MGLFALTPLATVSRLATDITVGDHVQKALGGLTFNWDTIWATAAAAIIVITMGVMLRRQATSGTPGRLQAAWELGVGAITQQVEGSIGEAGMKVIPLATTLFVFILTCNLFALFDFGAKYAFLIVPNADINMPLAMALYVIVLVHISSVRARGVKGYFAHYATQPFPMYLLPFNVFINLVEEISKPLTLALRLFGNLLSGTLMLTLIAALGAWKLGAIPIGNILVLPMSVIWKLFDGILIGTIQAFIFTLLTILYFDVAMTTDHGDHKEELLQPVEPVTHAEQPSLAA
jgi:F-type H+-transporting ATPase subunit a